MSDPIAPKSDIRVLNLSCSYKKGAKSEKVCKQIVEDASKVVKKNQKSKYEPQVTLGNYRSGDTVMFQAKCSFENRTKSDKQCRKMVKKIEDNVFITLTKNYKSPDCFSIEPEEISNGKLTFKLLCTAGEFPLPN